MPYVCRRLRYRNPPPRLRRRCCKLPRRNFDAHRAIFMLVTAVVLLCCSGVATAAPKTYCEELVRHRYRGQACQIQMSDPAYNINISLPSYYPDQA